MSYKRYNYQISLESQNYLRFRKVLDEKMLLGIYWGETSCFRGEVVSVESTDPNAQFIHESGEKF